MADEPLNPVKLHLCLRFPTVEARQAWIDANYWPIAVDDAIYRAADEALERRAGTPREEGR